MSAASETVSPVVGTGKERPILFSGPMVRAILAGTKTQTRRIINPRPVSAMNALSEGPWLQRKGRSYNLEHPGVMRSLIRDGVCKYGVVGDRLWVRETWLADPPNDGTWAYVQWAGCETSQLSDIPERYRTPEHCIFKASWPGQDDALCWRPSIFMPRWASRLTLEVTGVRMERLQDITAEDAQAEGIDEFARSGAKVWSPPEGGVWDMRRVVFRSLWDSINAERAPWASNCFVWVVEFKRVTP